MKIIFSFLCTVMITSCANAEEIFYTGSTPAGTVVRSFLEIPFADSVAFIRWQLKLTGNEYTLTCNYGMSKPNTNGFINGKQVTLKGALHSEKNKYLLRYGSKVLQLAKFNKDLLHIMDADSHLLVGNGGWSYTLNNLKPSISTRVNITSLQTPLKDSIVYEGRTPCDVPGIISADMQCYKLKWKIVLYGNAKLNIPDTYKVYGTPYRKAGGKTGKWKIITGKSGSIIYQLDHENGYAFLYLLKLDENLLLFINADEKLLVGDEDFSYTINKAD